MAEWKRTLTKAEKIDTGWNTQVRERYRVNKEISLFGLTAYILWSFLTEAYLNGNRLKRKVI